MGVEQGTHVVAVEAADLLEQRERLMPARQGGVGIAGVVQGLAECVQAAGLAETVAGLAVDGKGLVGVLVGLVVTVAPRDSPLR
jgi:hypothetical protein